MPGGIATRVGTVWLGVVVAGGCVAVVSGCGAARNSGLDRTTAAPPRVATSVGDLMSAHDHDTVVALARTRASAPIDSGYVIGADDLLDIRIPDLLDAQPQAARPSTGGGVPSPINGAPTFQQGMRVDARGEVTLPILGAVAAAGHTPAALERELAKRLVAAGILRTPQVSVQVAEYRSRVVAVVGSVERPGLYPLTRPGATLTDLIWAAGGPSKDAGRVVEFVPVGTRTAPGPDVQSAAVAMRPPIAPPSAPNPSVAASDPGRTLTPPIRLDLECVLYAAGRQDSGLDPQVRPGDVISVAPAGSVQVSGWVDKPGSYPVTRGLTLAGAVAAAGGNLFAANRRTVMVTRTLGPGEQRQFVIDLDAVANGHITDIPIADGDVVHLPYATERIIPWGIWTTAREMVHVGGSVLLF